MTYHVRSPANRARPHEGIFIAARGASKSALARAAGSAPLPRRSPREVGERLVRIRHLDGVLALGHGLALAAVGGHQLVGQPQEHRPAGLAARRPDEPADRQALLPLL